MRGIRTFSLLVLGLGAAACEGDDGRIEKLWKYSPPPAVKAEYVRYEPILVEGVRTYFNEPAAQVKLVGRSVGGDGLCGLARTSKGQYAVSRDRRGVKIHSSDDPSFSAWALQYCRRFDEPLGRDEWNANPPAVGEWFAVLPASDQETKSVAQLVREAEAAPSPTPIGTPISVPSDPRAQYYLLSLERNGSLRTAVTRREGPSGTSFARREIDCARGVFRYTGEGETLEEATSGESSGPFGPLTEGSISTFVSAHACRR